MIVRRERPHPGAQLSVFDCEAGYRQTAFITDQQDADIGVLELRHRRRARVEDAIRVAKETGMRKMPFAAFEHNRAWLEVSLLGQELLSWAKTLCLDGELSLAEPKRLCQRLLHVAARVVRSGRRTTLRLPLGRGAGDGVRAAADVAGRYRDIAHRQPSADLDPVARPDGLTVPANGAGRRDRRPIDPRGGRQGGFAGAPRCRYLPQITR